jgi:hypothetical protein
MNEMCLVENMYGIRGIVPTNVISLIAPSQSTLTFFSHVLSQSYSHVFVIFWIKRTHIKCFVFDVEDLPVRESYLYSVEVPMPICTHKTDQSLDCDLVKMFPHKVVYSDSYKHTKHTLNTKHTVNTHTHTHTHTHTKHTKHTFNIHTQIEQY